MKFVFMSSFNKVRTRLVFSRFLDFCVKLGNVNKKLVLNKIIDPTGKQTCQPKTRSVRILLFKKSGNVSLNREILESQEMTGTNAISLIVQSVNGHFWFICYLILTYYRIENILFFGDFQDYEDFLSCRDRCLVSTKMHAQQNLLDGNSWFEKMTQLILLLKPYKHTAFIPCWSNVEKVVSTSFQLGIHVVCLEGTWWSIIFRKGHRKVFRKYLFLNFSNTVKDNLDARDACWTKLYRLKYD